MKSISFTSNLMIDSLNRNNLKFTWIAGKSQSETTPALLFFKTSKPNRRLTLLSTPKNSHTTSHSPQFHVSNNNVATATQNTESASQLNTAVTLPPLTGRKFTPTHQCFYLLSFIAFTTSVAFIGLVTAAVPTLRAMSRAAIGLSKLADTAREELPSTMAALRLSGMEISDLTLELTDLSQEIADGVTRSTQAMQAAEVGIRKIGSLAHKKTSSMIEERANLPEISLNFLVAGAARKSSKAVGQATKKLINKISGDQSSSGNETENGTDNLSEDNDDRISCSHL